MFLIDKLKGGNYMELPNKVLAGLIEDLVLEAAYFDITVQTVKDLVEYLNGCGDEAYIDMSNLIR